ncbi:MAG TPA: metallophosphoesterase [Solirubrobacteraceae bacterium]
MADALPGHEIDEIEAAGMLRFHCVGDTGGLHNPGPQRAVAAAMADQLAGENPVRFFYHLGDVVYLHGEETHYRSQFFEPYGDYPAPIFAVAGNHDGDRAPGTGAAALDAFVRHFCAPAVPVNAGRSVGQPNVYWTLEHEWVTIIGLYTNVPEGGLIDAGQLRWLVGELSAARPGVTLILAMHHPVYSADLAHGSNLALGIQLEECFACAGRAPDAVFSAHAHNYQRFARHYEGRELPYVVAGSGGFPELHRLGYGIPDTPASFAGLPGLTLEAHQHAAFGFLTVSAGPAGARVDYNTVVRRRPVLFDQFWIEPAGGVNAGRRAGAVT